MQKDIAKYFKVKKEVIAVYLFGSYAQAKERHFSDIDIGILLDRRHQDSAGENRIKYMLELSRILRKDIHCVILNSASEELLRQIFVKGTCIVVNNPRELARYKTFMFAKIADFAYHKKQMQSGLIRKVMEGTNLG